MTEGVAVPGPDFRARRSETIVPPVSVIVPCRDEGRFIHDCLFSILENGYPRDRLEVLVVDGMSTDDTRDIVQTIAATHPEVRLLTNERRITPVALNIGVRAARGDYLLWMSAHNTYKPDYIRQCVGYAAWYGADNVGGGIVTVARDETLLAPFVVAALTHRFGVGASAFRLAADEPRWVDTVFGGCYRRDVFERVGMFNEALVRGQDMELNLRLRRAGMRTLLVPSVRSVYHARSRLGEFLRHNWTNGVWAVLPFLYVSHPPVALRHLVPMGFALALIGSLLLGLLVPGEWFALVILGGAYGLAALAASAHLAVRRRDIRYLIVTPFVFLSLHLSYGLGSVWGTIRLIGGKLRRALTETERVSAGG